MELHGNRTEERRVQFPSQCSFEATWRRKFVVTKICNSGVFSVSLTNTSCSCGILVFSKLLARSWIKFKRLPFDINLFPAIRCLSLSVPKNGVKVGCSGIIFEPYDSRCSFACNAGYNLVGSYARRCLENATWSGETVYCEGKMFPPL